MNTDLPVSNPPTCDDALRALNSLYIAADVSEPGAAEAMSTIQSFLERLVKMSEPASVIDTDEQGYIIEGAYQRGFEYIDDNADLLVVHANDLIKEITLQRTPFWIRHERRPIDPKDGSRFVKAWDAPTGHPATVWVGRGVPGIQTLAPDWYIRIPELPQVPE